MEKYTYKAKAEDGSTIAGEIEAANQASAAKVLMSKKLFPVEIKGLGTEDEFLKKIPILASLDRISKKKKAIIIRQLATLINAGLPITQSLETIARETANEKLKETFTDILHQVEGGSTLADAFAAHPDVFNSLEVSLVTAGEKSGNLDKVLKRMATQLEKEASLISKLKTAMIYPAIVFIVAIGVVITMIVYVVPKLSELYKDFKGELPVVTRYMMAAGNFIVNYWWLLILISVASIFAFSRYKKTPSGRKHWDSFKLKVPAIRILLVKIHLARFTRTMSTLIGSGVPLLDSLKITSDSVGNVIYKDEILKMRDEVRGGYSLSQAISKAHYDLFPSVAGQMIRVGEQTGEIDNMLDSLANYYEEEVDNAIKGLTTLVEPLMIVFMGVMVLIIMIAVMVPIYGVAQLVTKR